MLFTNKMLEQAWKFLRSPLPPVDASFEGDFRRLIHNIRAELGLKDAAFEAPGPVVDLLLESHKTGRAHRADQAVRPDPDPCGHAQPRVQGHGGRKDLRASFRADERPVRYHRFYSGAVLTAS